MSASYQTWERIRDRFAGERALTDVVTNRTWTFAEIQAAIDEGACENDGVRFPQGFSVDLVFETLQAWRDGAILCPVERQAIPVERFKGIPEGITHVKLTSGSTGEPRLVLFEAEQLAADARKIVTTMGLRRDWPNLGVISMAHSYGFSSLVLPLLLHGIPLIWLGDPLPGPVGNALELEEAWTLPAVPAMWRAWLETGTISDRIRIAISAGAPLPVDLEQEIHNQTGVKVHNFYGSTECGGIAYDRSDIPRESAGLVGSPMDETELSVNADGCLEVRGPSVASGYWPAEGEEGLDDDCFVTSDLASIEDGSVFLSGRRDDLINVAGRKISPARIEAAVLKAPEVEHCVAFGVASEDDSRLQEVVACVRLAGGDADPAAVRKRVQQELEAFEQPRHWWVCSDLGPDDRGKFSRVHWRDRFLDSRQEDSAPAEDG